MVNRDDDASPPLHRESRPSFYVNRRKQVFYRHGRGRGEGLTRLIRWLEDSPAPADHLAVAEQILERTYDFHQRQLTRVTTVTRCWNAVWWI